MSSKRCPKGYHKNKKTGRCNKNKVKNKPKPVIDEAHARLELYIETGNMEAVKRWLKNEGLDYRKLCQSKKVTPPRMKKTGVTYVYKKDDMDEEDLYNEKGELLIGKKFEQSSYLLIDSGTFTRGRYDINQYSAQNIGNASIDEIVDYIHNNPVYTLFMELWTWHHLPDEHKGKLLGSGVQIVVMKSYEEFFNRDDDDSSSDDEKPKSKLKIKGRTIIDSDDDDSDDENNNITKPKKKKIVDSDDDDDEDAEVVWKYNVGDWVILKGYDNKDMGKILERRTYIEHGVKKPAYLHIRGPNLATGRIAHHMKIVIHEDNILRKYELGKEEDESSSDEEQVWDWTGVKKKPAPKKSSPPVTPTPLIHDLTLSSDQEDTEDEEEELSCGIRTTIDKVADEFIKEYAPWTKRGLTRQQNVQRRQALILFSNANETDKNKKKNDYFFKWMKFDVANRKWQWYSGGNRFTNTNFEGADRWTREFYRTRRYSNDLFHEGRSPKTVSGLLKLYVWDRGNKYTIAGEHVNLELIFKHLPVNFTFSSKANKYWTGLRQRKDGKNTSYDYSLTEINRIELTAFQASVNKINDHFKDAVLSTIAPYLDPKDKPDELRQIMGWDIEAKFPEGVKKVIDSENLLQLGHCGPVRTRVNTKDAWRYRFGIHGTMTTVSRTITRTIANIYPQIYAYYISFNWRGYDARNASISNINVMYDFLADKSKTIAMVGWGTPAGRTGHARIFVKTGGRNEIYRLNVFDPWMKGIAKHRRGYNEISNYVSNRNFNGMTYSLVKLDRPAEQGVGEGSCSAISFTRAIALATMGYENGKTGDIEAWVPVFVKMLYNKYSSHTAAANKAARGGRFKLKL